MKRFLLIGFSLIIFAVGSKGQTLAIGSLNGGGNNVAASPLVGTAAGKAVFGFSVASSTSQTVSVINVQLSSTPSGKLSNWSLVKSTDTDFATGGDNAVVGGLTFTPTATQVGITGLSEVITTGSNYFLLADVDPAVAGATPAVQASIGAANVTVNAGTVAGSAIGTSYSFQALTLAITSLNAAGNNVALSPLGAASTGKAVLGFALASTLSQTVTAINVQLSSDPSGKLSNWSLVKSTDTNFASGGDNSTVGGLTFTPSATQVAITGLSQVITAGSNYFLVADINAGVNGATPTLQASIASGNVTAGAGSVTGSSTGTNYSFAGLILTIGSLNAGANNVALSPLGAGTTGKAVFGFSLTSSVTQTVTVINIQLSSDPSGKLGNWSLVKSTDANFASGGDNSTVGGTTFTPTASQVGITGLSQVVTTTANYFLVADVNAAASSSTTAIQASVAAANVTVGTGSVSGTATGTNYSFSSSQSSDIALVGGTTTALIAYGSSQAASGLTAANSVSLGQFVIQDGGLAANDSDTKSTTLTDVTIGIANFSNVRTIAIFDGATNLAEQAVVGNSAVFSALSLVAADDGTKTFRIRATFNSVVNDNDPITITINSATALSTGSLFAAANAGGATTGGATNLIDVVADRIVFGAAPVAPNPGLNFSLAVSAQDAMGNTDKNRTNTVTLSLTTGTGAFTSTDGGGLTPNLVNGARSWSQLKISTAGSKTITAAYTGLTSGTITFSIESLGVTITPASPVSVCYLGDFQTLTNITLLESDQSDFGTGAGQLFYLQLPTGFVFDTSVTTAPSVSGPDISAASTLSYVGTNIVRFSYNIGGTAGIDNFVISGLRIRYTGTTASSGNIKVINSSAQIAKDTESDNRNHGTLTAANSATVVDFSVFALAGDPTVPPNQTSFNISNKAVRLVGSPSGGVFTGAAVILSATNGYTFDPGTAGVGTFPITYTYMEPAAPHCQIMVTKTFDVSTSFITGLLTSYCTTSAPTVISVSQATVNAHHPASLLHPAGFLFQEFVYWEPTTGAFTTMPAPTTTFTPSDPVYATSINNYSRIWIGYRAKDAITGVVLYDAANDYANITYTSFSITNAPTLGFNLPSSVCVNGTAFHLEGLVTPAPANTVTDNFVGTGVTNPGTNQWVFTPNSVPGASSSPQIVNITYHYKDPAGTCSSVIQKLITVYPLPAAVPIANLNGGAGTDIQICQSTPPPQFTAAVIAGTTYNWYTNGGSLLQLNRNTFVPQVPPAIPNDFNNNNLGTTTFKVSQIVNGCEGPSSNITVTVTPPVVVNAGTSQQICAGSSLTLSSLGASITGAVTTGTWSSASAVGSRGTFSPNANFTTATTYTPSASEVGLQKVTLILTSTAPSNPCPIVVGSVDIDINSATTVIPGVATSFCAGQDQLIVLNGNIVGGVTTGSWSRTGGSGVFDNGLATSPVLSTVYIPTLAERNSPIPINITFTLTSDDPPGPCPVIANSVIYTLEPAPVVNAGVDIIRCADQPITLSGTFSAGASSVVWSTTGAGTFTSPGSSTSPSNTTYNPTAPEIANGANIAFTLTTDDPTGPCKAAAAALNLTFNPVPVSPTVNTPASTPGKVYYCSGDLIADLTAGGNNIRWYNNPGLTGSPATGNSFSPPISNTIPATTSFYVTQTNQGCESKAPLSAPTMVQVIVDPVPVPNFTASLLCFPDSTLFDASLTTISGGFSIVNYGWDFADQTSIAPGPAASTISTPATGGTYEKPYHFFGTGTYDVVLTAVSNTTLACSKSIQASFRPGNNVQVKIGPYPIPDFGVDSVCHGDITRFTGMDHSTNVFATNSWLWNFGESLFPNNTSAIFNPTHKYDTVKTAMVSLKVTSVLGCTRTIVKPVSILPYIKTFPTGGYHENFDSGPGGWVAEGLNANQFNSWQLTSPAERIITEAFSPPNAWVTNAFVGTDGFNTYHENERSVLNGPCFDMRKLDRPVMSMKYWEATDKGGDGAYVEFQDVDGVWRPLGHVGEGLGWYDTQSILGLTLANGVGQAVGQLGWSGIKTGWSDGKFNMDPFKDRNKLRIRFVFGSNNDNLTSVLDGFAIDDFGMENRNRTLLAESFTNLTADASNTNSQNFYNFQSALAITDLVKIEYHHGTGGPDALYDQDRADADARAGFYGVTSPLQGFISGTSGGTILASGGWSQAVYDVQSLVSSPLDLTITTTATNADMINIQVDVKTNEDLPEGEYVVQIGIIEKDVNGSKFVVRKLLPDGAGTPLTALKKDSTQTIPVSWNLRTIPALTDVGIVAFIQSLLSKDGKNVIQAAYLGDPIVPLPTVTGTEPFPSESVEVFPNPANKGFAIRLPSIAQRPVGLKLWDAMGKQVHDSVIPEGSFTKNISTEDLAGGVYILNVESGSGAVTRKRILVVHEK